MILPCTNLNLRSEVTQRIHGGCKVEHFLSIDVEQDMARLFKMECNFHVEVEDLKQ